MNRSRASRRQRADPRVVIPSVSAAAHCAQSCLRFWNLLLQDAASVNPFGMSSEGYDRTEEDEEEAEAEEEEEAEEGGEDADHNESQDNDAHGATIGVETEAEAEAEAEAKAERPYSFSHHIYECMYVCALPSFPSLSFLFESLLCPATTTR